MTIRLVQKIIQRLSLQPSLSEAREILISRGYYITEHNLIATSPSSEYAIGMIRNKSRSLLNPERILASYSVPQDPQYKDPKTQDPHYQEKLLAVQSQFRGLLKILNQEGIYYINPTEIRTNSKYEVSSNKSCTTAA